VTVTEDFRQGIDSSQHIVVGSLSIFILYNLNKIYFLDLIQSNAKDLVEELYLIHSNLNTLDQLLQQQITYISQIGLPTSNDDLLILYNQHKVRIYMIYPIRNHIEIF